MRLFVAVDVPTAARSAVADGVGELRAAHADLRWIPQRNWHLTLAFLGRATTGQRLRAQLAVAAAARRARPCALTIGGGLGRFGDRVLWADVTSADGCLAALAAAVRAELGALGLPVEDRAFTAHLTLARAGRGQRLPHASGMADGVGLPMRWTARSIALMASRPDRAGNRYRNVATWPLGAAPPA